MVRGVWQATVHGVAKELDKTWWLNNYRKWKWKSPSCVQPFATPWTRVHGTFQVRILLGSLFLLQGLFPIQQSNPGLLHCRQILYQLSHKGSSRILEWVAYPFSRGSSQPRNRTGVSCIAGGFFNQLSYHGNPQKWVKSNTNIWRNRKEKLIYHVSNKSKNFLTLDSVVNLSIVHINLTLYWQYSN